jgi:hypothetical protein
MTQSKLAELVGCGRTHLSQVRADPEKTFPTPDGGGNQTFGLAGRTSAMARKRATTDCPMFHGAQCSFVTMKAYHIKDWETTRENNDTRKYVDLLWFRNKVKLLGEGMGHTLSQPERQGPFLYGMFKIIEQIAAGGRKEQRGWLFRNGTPLDASRMGNLTRLPAAYFDEALTFFSSTPMDWLEHIEFALDGDGNPQRVEANRENGGRDAGDSPDNLPPNRDTPEKAGRFSASDRRKNLPNTNEGSYIKENGGFASKEEARKAQSQQFASASAQKHELEAIPEDERGEVEEAELKKTRTLIREIQKKQRKGDFTPVLETAETSSPDA